MLANGQPEASKNSYNPDLVTSEDSSVELSFGPDPPAPAPGNWIRTLPGKRWFTILRLYGPREGFMDRSWRPSDIELV